MKLHVIAMRQMTSGNAPKLSGLQCLFVWVIITLPPCGHAARVGATGSRGGSGAGRSESRPSAAGGCTSAPLTWLGYLLHEWLLLHHALQLSELLPQAGSQLGILPTRFTTSQKQNSWSGSG